MKLILSIVLAITSSVALSNTTSKVSFVKIKNNDVVPQTFQVEFAVTGMTVAKAGDLKPDTGHHHLIIDGSPIAKGKVIPKDETHKHFGDGATSTTLTLKPGKHTLTMQFADGLHKSFGEDFSTTIHITVK